MRRADAKIAVAILVVATAWFPALATAQTDPPSVGIWLTWDSDGVETRDGHVFLRNNLGYRVELRRGYVVNLSVELIPCEEWGVKTSLQNLSVVHSLIFGRPAWAGHSRFRSPSKLQRSTVETLAAVRDWKLGALTAPDVAYCQAHYLIGRAVAATKGLPANPDLKNLSLYLDGWFYGPTGNSRRKFEIKTAEASGRIVDIHTVIDGKFSGRIPAGANVAVRRRLASLFDNIDFSDPGAPETARTALSNLVRSISATVRRP